MALRYELLYECQLYTVIYLLPSEIVGIITASDTDEDW